MSDNLIVTAYRDALHRKQPVNKDEYIAKIHQSSLTKLEKSLCLEELNFVAWEFHVEPYSKQDLLQAKERLATLSWEEKSDGVVNISNATSGKWAKMQEASKKFRTLSPFSSNISSQKINVKNKRDNLIEKAKILLEKIRKEQNDVNDTVLDTLLSTLSPKTSIDTMQFMYDLIQFRRACKDKDGKEGGTEDCVKALAEGFALLSDADLQRNYEKMCSPEMVSLVNAFFTQRYILMHGDDIDAFEPAFRDAFSIWPMNKAWMKASIYHSLLEGKHEQQVALSMQPEDYAERAFISAAAQFYTLLMNVYECVCLEMNKRRLRGYTPCFMEEIDKQENQQPQTHALYLDFENDHILYRTHLSGEICRISREDCIAEGLNEDNTNQMFLSLQKIFLFNQDMSKMTEVVDDLHHLSLRNFKDHLQNMIKKYFHDKEAMTMKLEELCRNNVKNKNLLQIIQMMYAVNPQSVSDLVVRVRGDLLEDKMKHYLDNIILKITTKRGHTLPSQPTPFLSEWPVDSKGKPKKITLSPTEKILIGESVKANNPINRNKKIPDMKPSYWYAKKPTMMYFGKMIRSLGGGFNPNSFCDFLLTTEFTKLKAALEACDPKKEADKKKLKSLHKAFQDTDLTNLITLIKIIKEGGPEKHKEIYEWLAIKNPNVFLNKRFQEIIAQLYDAASLTMQSVREKLNTQEDYAYNDLQWKRSRIFTTKNSACMKRLLEVYSEGNPKKDFSYTWSETFSLVWNPGIPLKEPEEPLKELMREKMPDILAAMA